MALTALRQGEDSRMWRQPAAGRRAADRDRAASGDARRLSRTGPGTAARDRGRPDQGRLPGRRRRRDRATPAATRTPADAEDDASSRTELTMRLKAQARLGEDMPGKKAQAHPADLHRAGAAASACSRRRPAPWFEFVIDPQGEKVKRRLAWFSTATGAALFVNQRGQKYHRLDAGQPGAPGGQGPGGIARGTEGQP